MLSFRGYLLFSFSVLALAIAAFFYSPYIAVLSLPVSIFLISARILIPGNLRVNARREIDRKLVIQGDEVTVSVFIKNEGDSAIVKVTDVLPKNVKLVHGYNHFTLYLKRNEERNFSYSISPQIPGKYFFSGIDIEVTDPLQLYEVKKFIDTKDEINAYPFVYTSRENIIMLSLKNMLGENRSRRQGEGEEFYSVREYTPGDRIRRINWKAYARYQLLHTNQFNLNLSGEMMIILDSRFALLDKDDEEEQFRLCSSSAATIAYSAIMARNKVGLMVMGELLEKVPPAYGFKQLRRILTLLSDFRPGRRWQISRVNSYLSLLFPLVNDVIIVTPLLDEEILKASYSLHQEGYNNLVISPNHWLHLVKKTNDREKRIAIKLLLLKREYIRRKIENFARVVDWDVSIPLPSAINSRVRMARGA